MSGQYTLFELITAPIVAVLSDILNVYSNVVFEMKYILRTIFKK